MRETGRSSGVTVAVGRVKNDRAVDSGNVAVDNGDASNCLLTTIGSRLSEGATATPRMED